MWDSHNRRRVCGLIVAPRLWDVYNPSMPDDVAVRISRATAAAVDEQAAVDLRTRTREVEHLLRLALRARAEQPEKS
jgi:hypothetical protein